MARIKDLISEFLENHPDINFVLVKHFRDDKYLSVVFCLNGEIKRNLYLDEVNKIMRNYNSRLKKSFEEGYCLISNCEEYPGIVKKTIIGHNIIDLPDLIGSEYEANIERPNLGTEINHLLKQQPLEKRREIINCLENLGVNIDPFWLRYMKDFNF